jgi:hypothetical protein
MSDGAWVPTAFILRQPDKTGAAEVRQDVEYGSWEWMAAAPSGRGSGSAVGELEAKRKAEAMLDFLAALDRVRDAAADAAGGEGDG